jgi:hypothetical protein
MYIYLNQRKPFEKILLFKKKWRKGQNLDLSALIRPPERSQPRPTMSRIEVVLSNLH